MLVEEGTAAVTTYAGRMSQFRDLRGTVENEAARRLTRQRERVAAPAREGRYVFLSIEEKAYRRRASRKAATVQIRIRPAKRAITATREARAKPA